MHRLDVPSPSAALVGAALLGLLGPLGCSSSDDGESAKQQGVVTSSTVDPTMTIEAFTKKCDAADGKVEVHPHCGGVNSCKGFSYDQTTQTFTEHTCTGLNTCAGWSCVVP